VSTVLDIAWARPTVAQIKATGAIGVIRYFSTDPTKDLQASEVTAYPAAGLKIGTVYETTAGRATAGQAAGVADARAAEAERVRVGLPTGHIHYFAVDSDVSWAAVAPYFAGAASVIGKSAVGVYGGVNVIDGAAAAGYHWLWQTAAWSAGRVSAHALLYQNGSTTLGGGADINTVLAADWGQYPRPAEPDMPLTAADADLVATAVINKIMGGTTGGSFNRDLLVGPFFYWLQRVFDPTIPLPTGANLPPVVAEVVALRKKLASLATVDLTPADLQAISTELGTALAASTADELARRLQS
jgi:hypothetical protein